MAKKFSNGQIEVETFGSIHGYMPQVDQQGKVDYETERMMCEYDEKSQYVERNTKNGNNLYPKDTEEYLAEMKEIEAKLANKGFKLV